MLAGRPLMLLCLHGRRTTGSGDYILRPSVVIPRASRPFCIGRMVFAMLLFFCIGPIVFAVLRPSVARPRASHYFCIDFGALGCIPLGVWGIRRRPNDLCPRTWKSGNLFLGPQGPFLYNFLNFLYKK